MLVGNGDGRALHRTHEATNVADVMKPTPTLQSGQHPGRGAGIATAAVGLVPGYDKIGIWGAVILTFLRLIQGIGVGGEWGGSVLLAMEWAQTNKNRGFITSWPQFGAPAGLFLANVAVLSPRHLVVCVLMNDEAIANALGS